jgi:hypothetical protein
MKLEFIEKIKDVTGRELEGYFDNETQEYILIYKDDEIRKHTSDIYDGLYDPFVELKLIHNSVDNL